MADAGDAARLVGEFGLGRDPDVGVGAGRGDCGEAERGGEGETSERGDHGMTLGSKRVGRCSGPCPADRAKAGRARPTAA